MTASEIIPTRYSHLAPPRGPSMFSAAHRLPAHRLPAHRLTVRHLRRQIDKAFRDDGLEPPLDSVETVSFLTARTCCN